MSEKFLIATGNRNKIAEIQASLRIFNLNPKIVTPDDIGLASLDPIENSDTLRGNALIKANEFYLHSKIDSLADDTGLVVDDLGGRPGVKSARYAGDSATSADNRKLLLEELADSGNRKARFKTVFCFKTSDETYFFEGICEGRISLEEKGESGFGYDPIFIPDGFDRTFAEIDAEIKNAISHRALAVKSFAKWLSKKYS